MLEKITVACGLIWRHGCFLAAQRPDNKPMAGYWELPGGKQEGNETPEETLCRELAEELGINARTVDFYGIVEHPYPERGFTALLHFYHVREFQGEPCPKEGQNLRWIMPEEAQELDFLPADAAILKSLPQCGQGNARCSQSNSGLKN